MPDDMRIPSRESTQIDKDAIRTSEHIQQLGEAAQGLTPDRDLDEILRTRHAEMEGALEFETVWEEGEPQSLVVSRQLLVPDSHRRGDADFELTNNRRFRKLSVDDSRCAKLHELVWVYSYDDDSDDDAREAVDQALAFLNGPDNDPDSVVRAARPLVTALQMVVKSVDGPAPTSVDWDPFTVDEAALTMSQDQVKVAVIDTGIDKELREDGWLNDVERDDDDDNDPDDDYNIDKLDVFHHLGKLDFGAGHGTFVAGIVRQVDPEANIVVYRALDTDGVASEEAVACAMIRAADDGANVINLSVGMKALDPASPCPALHAAVEYIKGLDPQPAIVAAAGNYGSEDPVYPAALDGVISVAALRGLQDPNMTNAPPPEGAEWSSRGEWVRCSTIGEGIVSTFVRGEEDSVDFGGHDSYPLNGEGESWAVWSGTSFAAPQIAAHIAKQYRADRAAGGSPQDAAMTLFPTTGVPDGYGKRVVLLPGTRRSP